MGHQSEKFLFLRLSMVVDYILSNKCQGYSSNAPEKVFSLWTIHSTFKGILVLAICKLGTRNNLEENITRCCNSPILQEVFMSYFGESPSFNFNRTYYVAEIFDYPGRFLIR